MEDDPRALLTLWFQAVWWVTSRKNGVSAMSLQRVRDLKSYKTVWTMLHKLRRAISSAGGMGTCFASRRAARIGMIVATVWNL